LYQVSHSAEEYPLGFDIMAWHWSKMFRLNLTVSRWIALGGICLCFLSACAHSQSASPTLQATPEKFSTKDVKALSPLSTKTPKPLPTIEAAPTLENTVNLRGQLVQFWYVREAGGEELMPKLVEEFNKTNQWGIRAEAVPYDSSGMMDEALRTAFEEKKLPAVLAGYSHDLRYWHSTGISLADLQAYIENSAWGLSKSDQQDFFPAIWTQDAQTPTGENTDALRLGLPWYRTGLVMLYNQSWAKDLGFDAPPTTPAQFRQQACAAAKANREDDQKGNDATGGWLIDSEPSTLLSWIFAFGGKVENTGQGGYEFENSETIDTLTFIHDLYTEGCAWRQDEPEKNEILSNRSALFLSASLRELVNLQAVRKSGSSDDVWTILPFPSRKGGAFDIFGPSLAVLKSTQTKQLAAWLFVRWLASPENQARWVLATETLPTRASVLPLLIGKQSGSSLWEKALDFLPYMHVEPALASWRSLRWALGDVMSQLTAPEFKGEQIPALLEALDQLAEEVQAQGSNK
jgi:multiple sugar transport system substrate-binding protein